MDRGVAAVKQQLAIGGSCAEFLHVEDEQARPIAILVREEDRVIAVLDAALYDDKELSEEFLRTVREARREPGDRLVCCAYGAIRC